MLLCTTTLILCCSKKPENLMGTKLKELNKQNESILSEVVANDNSINTQDWQTFSSKKGFSFKYPAIFEVSEGEVFTNLYYKNQSKEKRNFCFERFFACSEKE